MSGALVETRSCSHLAQRHENVLGEHGRVTAGLGISALDGTHGANVTQCVCGEGVDALLVIPPHIIPLAKEEPRSLLEDP